MDLKSLQAPLKDGYRAEPDQARITLTARGSQTDSPIGCSVDIGRALYEAQAHSGVGGAGTAACSGDLDLRGTLGVGRDAPVGFEEIRTCFRIDAPEASEHELDGLMRKTERYCVVLQTLRGEPSLTAELARA